MPEAGKVVLETLFNVGYIRIQAIHHHANLKSGRVMQKLGMAHEGCLAKCNLDKDGNLVYDADGVLKRGNLITERKPVMRAKMTKFTTFASLLFSESTSSGKQLKIPVAVSV